MNKISIKMRLLFLVAMPVMAVLVLSMMFLNKTFEQKNNLEATHNRVLEVQSIAKTIHNMQIERALSVGYVASGGEKNKDKLPDIRQKVDSAIAEVKEVFEKTLGDSSMLSNLSELNQKRGSVDSLSINTQETAVLYKDNSIFY